MRMYMRIIRTVQVQVFHRELCVWNTNKILLTSEYIEIAESTDDAIAAAIVWCVYKCVRMCAKV